MKVFRLAFMSLMLLISNSAYAVDIYVDSVHGKTGQDGFTIETALKSMDEISLVYEIENIYLAKGSEFRSFPYISSNINYIAYGKGNDPIVYGSKEKNNPLQWEEIRKNIWRLKKVDVVDVELIQNGGFENGFSNWGFWHTDNTVINNYVDGSNSLNGDYCYTIECTNNHGFSEVQLYQYLTGISLKQATWYYLSFWAKSTEPFVINNTDGSFIDLIDQDYAPIKTAYYPKKNMSLNSDWQKFEMYYFAGEGQENVRLNSLFPEMPDNSIVYLDDFSMKECISEINEDSILPDDIGNIVFNDGESIGHKVWSFEELDVQGKFYYDSSSLNVYVYSDENPAEKYNDIELAVTKSIVHLEWLENVSFVGIHFKYGGAHGISTNGINGLVVKNCTFTLIGGGEHPAFLGTRYGNGIELFNDAGNVLVYFCKFVDNFDAAVTNQGVGEDYWQYNIIYKNNVIINAEYALEVFANGYSDPAFVHIVDVHFVNNTCYGIGKGKFHDQRPDPSGRGVELTIHSDNIDYFDVEIHSNIFANVNESVFHFWSDQLFPVGANVDNNCYYNYNKFATSAVFELDTNILADFQSITSLDVTSIEEDPLFVDTEKGNFNLIEGSICRKRKIGAFLYDEDGEIQEEDSEEVEYPDPIPGGGAENGSTGSCFIDSLHRF